MSIQQALFAGSSVSANWPLVDTWTNAAQGDSVSMPNTQSGDILLAFLGWRSIFTPAAGSTFTTITRFNNGGNNIGCGVFAKVCSGPTSFSTSFEFANYDYVFYCAFRALNAFTSPSSVLWKVGTGNGSTTTPTHNNTVASFGTNSLALPVAWYSLTASPPWVPPANTALVGVDNPSNNTGSVAVSSQEIGTAGGYSWGAWGSMNTGVFWTTGYVEVQQP